MTSDNQCPGPSPKRKAGSSNLPGGQLAASNRLRRAFLFHRKTYRAYAAALRFHPALIWLRRQKPFLLLQHVQNRPLGKLLLQVNHFADFLWSVRGQVPLLSGDTFQLNCSILQSGTISNSNMKENGLSPLPGFVTAQKSLA